MDIRRSILWVIFTASVIFLYNSWLRSHGEAGLFGQAPSVTASAPAAAGSGVPAALASAAPGTPGAPAAAAP
ncbi:MAG: membrane protein insertase YidC, partial [Betaproteobacteria bacterium]|nr:membrane protein insertase YidC [Betaproteobacteria bacterium]